LMFVNTQTPEEESNSEKNKGNPVITWQTDAGKRIKYTND